WGVNVALAIAPTICIDYTGTDEKKAIDDEVQIFPNPSTGIFNLKTRELENKKIDIRVYNSLGELVINKVRVSAGDGELNFDLSQHPQGLYIVGIGRGEHTVIKKINLIH
ncbi:MAG: T9SS type A sorting domain-containing protein, partial [Flavobacterium sp.]